MLRVEYGNKWCGTFVAVVHPNSLVRRYIWKAHLRAEVHNIIPNRKFNVSGAVKDQVPPCYTVWGHHVLRIGLEHTSVPPQ